MAFSKEFFTSCVGLTIRADIPAGHLRIAKNFALLKTLELDFTGMVHARPNGPPSPHPWLCHSVLYT